MVMATVDVTLIMGPPVGGFIETSFGSQALYLVSLALVSFQCVIAFFLPSSMWRSGHALAGEKATAKSPLLGDSEGIVQVKSASGKAWGDVTFISKFAQSLAILNRSNFFRILAAIAFLQSFVSSGVTILYIYAMRSGFHFTMDDENLFLTIAFTASAFSQFLLVKPMGKCLGMLGLLVLGLTSGVLNSLLNGIVLSLLDGGLLSQSTSKLFVYIIAGSISSFTFFAFPAIGALKANNVGDDEQSSTQGALYAAKSAAGVISPMIYGSLWSKFAQRPAILYFISAGASCLVLACVTLLLPKRQREK